MLSLFHGKKHVHDFLFPLCFSGSCLRHRTSFYNSASSFLPQQLLQSPLSMNNWFWLVHFCLAVILLLLLLFSFLNFHFRRRSGRHYDFNDSAFIRRKPRRRLKPPGSASRTRPGLSPALWSFNSRRQQDRVLSQPPPMTEFEAADPSRRPPLRSVPTRTSFMAFEDAWSFWSRISSNSRKYPLLRPGARRSYWKWSRSHRLQHFLPLNLCAPRNTENVHCFAFPFVFEMLSWVMKLWNNIKWWSHTVYIMAISIRSKFVNAIVQIIVKIQNWILKISTLSMIEKSSTCTCAPFSFHWNKILLIAHSTSRKGIDFLK